MPPLLRRDGFKIQAVFEFRIDKCKFNDGTQDRSTQPRPYPKKLANSVISNFSKT